MLAMGISAQNINRLKKTYAIILGLSCIGYVVRWVSGQFSTELNIILLFTSIIFISASWEYFWFINKILNKKFPYERSIAGRIALQIVLGILFALLIRFLIYTFGEPILPFKLDSLFLAATWFLYVLLSVGLNAIFFINFFIGKWKESIVKTERLEKEKSHVQFDNLKNQLNPHFLFNALSSLNSMIKEDQQLASRFVQHLSKVYRYVLQNKERSSVSLQNELDFVSNYVFLLEARFQDAVTISFDIAEEMKEKSIVPVTLQILIENAIKHNIADRNRPLQIDIFTSGDYLVVSNNLQVRKLVEDSNKVGLENLKSLYTFLSAKPVIVEATADRFYVKVPLL